MDFVNKIFRGDRVIWMVFLFLCLISIVEVYSATSTLTFNTDDYWKPILRHSSFLLTGLGIVLATHAIPARFFSGFGILLPVTWLLMIGTRLFGEPVNGAYRWISFGGTQGFQPSEIAKICLISFTAFILSKRKDKKTDKSFQWILIATLITCGIIAIDNGSTAIMLFGIIFLMMLVGQIPFRQTGKLLLGFGVGVALFVTLVNFVPSQSIEKYLPRQGTWLNRFNDFKEGVDVHDPKFKITDDNSQVSHANIAIANGGVLIFGRLPGNSIERDFLPLAYADFIYAIIIEETGLIGGLGVLLLYIIIFIRAGIIANRSEKLFQKYIVMGSALILVTQALANMVVAVGLSPVTGQTLPLISRGGTSILITCIYFGIILSVSNLDNPKGKEQEKAIIEEYNEDEKTAESNH
jgi:cell division protein FtsW